MRMFNCVEYDGQWLLAADMRLECYTSQWGAYALFALVYGIVYVAGFPLGVLGILLRHRRTLFGDKGNAAVAHTTATYGFLYTVYGPTAWYGGWRTPLQNLRIVTCVFPQPHALTVQRKMHFDGAHATHAHLPGLPCILYPLTRVAYASFNTYSLPSMREEPAAKSSLPQIEWCGW